MIDSRILQALEHPNPDIRKKAIVALGKSKNAQAMPILAKVFKQDADPEVREYARKAGLYIYSQQNQATPPPVQPQPAPVVQQSPAPIIEKPVQAEKTRKQHSRQQPSQPKPKPVVETPPLIYVSQEKIAEAEEYVQFAFKSIHIGETVNAEKLFRKAFDINPALIHDRYVSEAVHKLLDKSSVEESVKVLLKINYSAHIVYSKHARERMELRDVTEEQITFTVDESDSHIFEDDGDVRFMKSIRRFDGQMRLLNVVAKPLETKSRTRDKWLIKTVYVRGEEDDGTVKPAYRYNNRQHHRPSKQYQSRWDNKRNSKHRKEASPGCAVLMMVILLFSVFLF
jgi:hypothetical protein